MTTIPKPNITTPNTEGTTMDANNPTPENTTPRPTPLPSEMWDQLKKLKGEAAAHRLIPLPADERPAHAVPLTDLTEEQRTRVEALHAARRVLGNPINRDGQLPYGWSDTATELADYIVTGTIFRDLHHDDEEQAPVDAPAQPAKTASSGFFEFDMEGDLPEGMPDQVKQAVERFREQMRQRLDPETRRTNIRKYVDEHRDKPDGYKELNAQGIFPVDGSEPPRSESLHDIDGRHWNYNHSSGVWEKQPTPADLAAGPHLASATWGIALAEFGPFHSCA